MRDGELYERERAREEKDARGRETDGEREKPLTREKPKRESERESRESRTRVRRARACPNIGDTHEKRASESRRLNKASGERRGGSGWMSSDHPLREIRHCE